MFLLQPHLPAVLPLSPSNCIALLSASAGLPGTSMVSLAYRPSLTIRVPSHQGVPFQLRRVFQCMHHQWAERSSS
ncbi:exported protein of unknown function [Nitrospira moscoviensis]|uniref:Uncharacterized protein n=1 Tax=Nitrospira moscoviensis TaxID=42253 RepID=A0A0K2GAS1_NITMO|nr:exported protein of unknown function [Nitrospira moscoviensis]